MKKENNQKEKMDWEGSPLSSSVSSQQASPQRSPSLSVAAMLPPPPSPTVVVGAGTASRARGVSSSPPSSLSPPAHSSHSQFEQSSSSYKTVISSPKHNPDTNTSSILSPASPLQLTGPRSSKSQHNIMVGSTSTSPLRSSALHPYSPLSGPQSPVALIASSASTSVAPTSGSPSSSPSTIITKVEAASLNSWKSSSSSVAGRLQLDHHPHHHRRHHHQQFEFHSQSYRSSGSSTTSSTTKDDSHGAVDLVASNKTISSSRRIQDQPEELVVTATTPSLLSSPASIAGHQKHHHHQLLGVPFVSSSSPSSSISSSTLLLRRRSRHEEVVTEEEAEDKEQKHPTDLSNPTKTNTNTTTTTSQQHQKNCRNQQEEQKQQSGGGGSNSEKQLHHQQKQTSSSHQVPSHSIKKHKPIPPPLDLSIGANLSLHHQHNHNTIIGSGGSITANSSTTTANNHSYSITNHNNNHQQIIHNPPQPTSPIYLGSPKFADNKSLPLRKRYQWSPPTQMNGEEHGAGVVAAATTAASSASSNSMVPLYADSQQHNNMASKTGLAGVVNAAGVTTSGDSNNGTSPGSASLYRSWGLDSPVPLSAPPNISSTSSRTNNHHAHHHHISLASTNTSTSNTNSASNIPNSVGLHTPTPFFTPNEPSPKFMNSPVFSYSNPDTALYQGPFSPIRASALYPPPNSPFTNLSLNSPLPPLQSSVSNSSSISGSSSNSSNSSHNGSNSGGTPVSTGGNGGGGSGGIVGNPCFNMIPSTLLSPAPSQASTNSLSYEDLHEKSLSLFTPLWSIFMPGTKVRFVGGMNSMDWYLVDFLAQSGDSLLGLKGEYAPHGLELRKLVMTSSPKERVQLTFCPVGDPNHPTIEVNCEPGHPFMVDKKGWCAVKPEVFQETYGSPCQQLEGGDICHSLNAARSPNNNVISLNSNNHNASFLQQQQQHQQSLMHHHSGFTNSMIHGSSSNVSSVSNLINSNSVISTSGVGLSNMHNLSHLHQGSIVSANTVGNHSMASMKMEPMDDKPIPISVLPQNQHGGNIHMQVMQSPPPPPLQHHHNHHHQRSPGVLSSRKTSAAVAMSAPGSPAKRAKDGKDGSHGGEQPAKGRRPMNAFLLFAKDKRPELIQKFPGKDNRTISVLLGEAWQKLAAPERERYASNAKARAEEQKRIHPDCWKRKRSQSTSS